MKATCGEETCERDFEELRKNMRRLWELETEAEILKLKNRHYPAIMSEKQKGAEVKLLRGMKRLDDGRYQAPLWQGEGRPPNNYEAARKTYLRWEERLTQDDHMHQAYHYAMKRWIDCQYLKHTENTLDDNQNFLTCFMVFKEGQPLEKARLVVNAARKFQGGSLNDCLEPGANVINDIGDLLLRLRRHRHVTCCDLADMFLNH